MRSFNYFCDGYAMYFLYLLFFASWYNLFCRLPRDFDAISLLPLLTLLHRSVDASTKGLTTHWKTLPITHYRVSTFAAVLKGIFFIYCFLSFNTLCIPVCRAILMQYLCRLSYTFHHLVGEITKDIATHCKTLFIKALRSFNYFFNVLKLISVIFTFYVLYNMHFRILCRLFWIFSTAR